MKIIKLFLLLALVNYCFNSFYACTNTANTLSLGEPTFDLKNGVPVIQSDCKDRPLCFFSCNDVFSNSNCDTKKYGVEVTDKKAYNKGCQLGYSHYDDIYFYLRHQLKYKGKLLSKSTEKYMKKGFSVLKDYLRQIRVNEWCKTEGDYRLRQSQLLEQFQKSSKNSKKITQMESKNDAEFNKFVFDQQNELLTRYRNKNAEQQKCSCGNVLRYLNNKDKKQVVKFVDTWKRFCSPKCVQGCNNSLCKDYKYKRDNSFVRFKRETDGKKEKKEKKDKTKSKQTKKDKKSKSEKKNKTKKNTKKTKSSPKPITIVINNNNKGRRGSGCCGNAPIPPPPPFFMNQPGFPQQFVAQPQFGGQNFQQQAQFNGNQQATQQTFQQQGQFNGNQQVAQGNNVIQGGNQQAGSQQGQQQTGQQQAGEQTGQQNGNQQAQTGEQNGNQQTQAGEQNGNQQASEQNGNQQAGEQAGNQQPSEQNQSGEQQNGEQSNGDNSSQQGKNGKKGRKDRNSLPTKGIGRGGKLRNSNRLVGAGKFGRKGKVGANMVSNGRRNSSNQRSNPIPSRQSTSNNRAKPSRSNPSPSRQSTRQSSSTRSNSTPSRSSSSRSSSSRSTSSSRRR